MLGGAAFTGFEGALLAIAISSSLGISGVSYLVWLGILASLILAQARRVIEGLDLSIIGLVTLAIVLGVSQLHGGFSLESVVAIAALAGLSAVAITALFRLIYKLLSSIF